MLLLERKPFRMGQESINLRIFYLCGLRTIPNPMVDEVDFKEDYSIYERIVSLIFYYVLVSRLWRTYLNLS